MPKLLIKPNLNDDYTEGPCESKQYYYIFYVLKKLKQYCFDELKY